MNTMSELANKAAAARAAVGKQQQHTVSERNAARAKALSDLKALHEDEYAELYKYWLNNRGN